MANTGTISKPAPSDRHLQGDTLSDALGELKKLPLLPTTAQEALEVARQPHPDLKKFTRLVEKDITLATGILKLANSPLFNWGRRLDSLDEAVTRLGFKGCQNLILAASMQNLFGQCNQAIRDRCQALWQHCFLVACLCRRLGQELKFDYKGEEFSAGLLHDLGRILIAVQRPDVVDEADPLDFVEDERQLEKERMILSLDHCWLGAEYAKLNRLPLPSLSAIRHHHQPEEAKEHRSVVGLVAFADHLANYVQRRPKEPYRLAESAGYAFLARGWSEEQCQSFQVKLPGLLKEVLHATKGGGEASARPAPQRQTAAPREPTHGPGVLKGALKKLFGW